MRYIFKPGDIPSNIRFQLDDQELFRIEPDGRIVRGAGFTTDDEMSLKFWDLIEETFHIWRARL